MVKISLIKSFSILLLLSVGCQSSYLKNVEEFQSTDIPEDVEVTTIEQTLAKESKIIEICPPNEAATSKSEPEELINGSFFLLKMTILQPWQDDYTNKDSATFKNLAQNLQIELDSLIGNSQETAIAQEPNALEFNLVLAMPADKSLEKIYVVLVITSNGETSGEVLSLTISNQINLYGRFYEIDASSDRFEMTSISQREAESEYVMCGSSENFKIIFIRSK